MSSTVERKLAAIMFTDIAGYTEQMSKNQDLAFILLEEKQSKFKPLIKEHNGTLIKEMGDGTLSQYPTAVDASKCSVELQKVIHDNDQLNVRVGIHLGDTLFKDGDVFGDGVNIASRLESMSPAGGILVSKNVYDELLSRQGFEGISLGLQSLKGVGRLVEVYALKDAHLAVPNPDDYKDTKVDVHTDDEVPSIAIIPFENKGAEEDVFYAYGISADLISDVSSAGLIRVASKKDIEKLDYTNLDNTQLSQKLFVRYIANGELWRMGDMFQLSIELYDTKDKKVVWSDRWQEKWDNLPTIKMNLSDGLLKALDTTSKVEKRAETTNTKAYELYLKATHTFAKRKDTNDIETARELLRQAIELDDNMIAAKVQLAVTSIQMGDHVEAMEIYIPALEQAENLGDMHGMGHALNNIGNVHWYKGEYDNALEYYDKSLKIYEEIGDRNWMSVILNNIGVMLRERGNYEKSLEYCNRVLVICDELDNKGGTATALSNIGMVHLYKGEYDKALDCYDRALTLKEEIGDKSGMAVDLISIGLARYNQGDYDKAVDYYNSALMICKKLGFKAGVGFSYWCFGMVHYSTGNYNKAEEHLEKSLNIQKEIGVKQVELITTTYLYLTYKHLSKDYNKNDIHTLIKKTENIEFELNLRLYQLLEDTSYLEIAYKQVQGNVSAMKEELGKTFLGYPLPTAIVEEYNKVFKK